MKSRRLLQASTPRLLARPTAVRRKGEYHSVHGSFDRAMTVDVYNICHGSELSGLDLSSPIAAPLIDAFRSPPPWSGTTTRLPSVDDLQSAVFLHVAWHILRTVTKPDTSH